MSKEVSKASQTYWDSLWQQPFHGQWVNPYDGSIRNRLNVAFHELFKELLSKNKAGDRLLEIGCAQSRWLPYFSKEFGFEVAGIDYSELGCEQARKLLKDAGVASNVVHTDFFSPPANLTQSFDVVISFGVVEHYHNTAKCLEALAVFAKPGGCIITIIPNMKGFPGLLQKHVGREIYDLHVPLASNDLAEANVQAGLLLRRCDYFLGLNLEVLILTRWRNRFLTFFWRKGLRLISLTYWFFDKNGLRFPPNAWTSPYVVSVGFKNG